MKRLVEYSPMHGRWTYVEDDEETGDRIFTEAFDKRHALATKDRAQQMAADGLGRGKDMRLAFSLSPYIMQDMRNRFGVEPRNRDHWPKVFALVRTEYPHLLVNKV